MVSALAGIAKTGRYGRPGSTPGVTARELTGFGLATVSARNGSRSALVEAARGVFGLELPMTPRCADGPNLSMIWCGPDQWLAMAPEAPAQGMEALLRGSLGAHAAIADQSHARVLLRLSGPRLRDTLAKGIPIDLHPRAFKPGDTAATQVSHVGIQIWQIDSAPTYDIAAYRSTIGSLWHWLETSAAEYGLEFVRSKLRPAP